VVFVVDDLAAWLVGLLADAGRKKLTKLVLGDAQERALQQAVIAAVQDTADELSPSDGQRAGQIVMVINQVFHAPVPDAPLAEAATLVEGLQAGIASQLAVLDDARLTGTGQSSAEVLRAPGTVLADRLTGHLVREIMFRGSGGGPLTPLADQLNHDLTHLQVRRVEVQGQRVEGMLARLADEIRPAVVRPGTGAAAAGRPLAEVTDPFALEVHRPVQLEDSQPRLSALPTYMPRRHDAELGSVVEAAAAGSSGIAVLVGGSSTGKTRACWEALQLLRGRQPGWRLWHPIDPSRPDAALREIPGIGVRTVVWLNEAQFYLDVADGGLGERVAAGLRELLRDSARAPVLVLATLWPQFWSSLTAPRERGADPHAQARELLAGHDITVPTAFTPAQMGQLGQAGDARLEAAAAGAQDGQVIQYLAGVPELLARYRNAPPAATALIHAAMDARRLGMRPTMPHSFLEGAALAYLTDAEWNVADEDWLERALAYAATPCKGVPGPLTQIRPRPARSRMTTPVAPEDADHPASDGDGPMYRLADYLDQQGRRHRNDQIPPTGFWAAAIDHVHPGDQVTLGDAACARGLLRDAAQLYKCAVARGDSMAAARLVGILHDLQPADKRPARWVIVHAALDNPLAVVQLMKKFRDLGADQQITGLLDREPASHVALRDPDAVACLLDTLRHVGADEQITALLDRDPASNVALDSQNAVAHFLNALRQVGADEQVTALLDRDPASNVAPSKPGDMSDLVHSLRRVGADQQIATLLDRDPSADSGWFTIDDDEGLSLSLSTEALSGPGPGEPVTGRYGSSMGDNLAREFSAAFNDPDEAVRQQAAIEADLAIAHIHLDDLSAVATMLDVLRAAGADRQIATLLSRDPAAYVTLDDIWKLTHLLQALRDAGADQQIAVLLSRDPASHVALDKPASVAHLLATLRDVGADQQIAALLSRDPASHVALDVNNVSYLLNALREVGADQQLTELANRLPAAGLFDMFQEHLGSGFRFGYEPDGRPAAFWGWDDLD
jgi:hypothetical protein